MGAVTMETGSPLLFEDQQQREAMLYRLNTLRKNGQFCDVVLTVGEHEIPAHRAVLASVSQFMFDLFSCSGDDKFYPQFKLKDMEYISFEHLLNYAYTSKLELPPDEVTGVYRAALKLKMGEVAEACAQYLASNLTPANCLGVRESATEVDLKQRVDCYIQNNFGDVVCSNTYCALPRIHTDVIGADEDLLSASTEQQLFKLVLDWAHNNISEKKPTLQNLTEHSHVLYLSPDNSLTDCRDLSEKDTLNQAPIIQDYKKISRKRNGSRGNNGKEVSSRNPRSPNVKRFSLQGLEDSLVKEWTVVAAQQTSDRMYSAVAMLNGTMVTIGLHFVTAPSSPIPEIPNLPKSQMIAPVLKNSYQEGRHASLVPLENMSCARCAVGVVVQNDKLIVCGGYDRGECMPTVESFDLDTNNWSPLPPMMTQRGRFDITNLNGKLYACGGSNGSVELRSVERFDPKLQKWSYVAKLSDARSNCGVAVLDGKLYCIGGSTGVSSVDTCEVYDAQENKWRHIAPLISRRSQAAVCAYAGKLVAVGGSDGWNCMNSVEMYDPATNTWYMVESLNTARRGAGVAVLCGSLYVVGGNDGAQSLATIEVYDLYMDSWMFGPSLTTPRANVGLAVMDERMFAVGGFSGKVFLDTIEYLKGEDDSTASDGAEWCTYVPVQATVIAERVREKRQSGEHSYADVNKHLESIGVDQKSNEEHENGHIASANGHTTGHSNRHISNGVVAS